MRANEALLSQSEKTAILEEMCTELVKRMEGLKGIETWDQCDELIQRLLETHGQSDKPHASPSDVDD
jgi:hypothetical protein